MVARGGLPLGVDFSGGTIVVLKFDRAVGEDAVRNAVASIPGDKVVQSTATRATTRSSCGCPWAAPSRASPSSRGPARSSTSCRRRTSGKFEVLSTEVVGPVIGADLQRKGIYATLASIVGITIYIALRFRPSFAVGAIAATFHDIFVVLAFLAFFGYELSLNVVAAILTITGYSVNDTIVIFDRVRENLRIDAARLARDTSSTLSVNQTLGPDDHHRRDDVPGGASRCTCSAARCSRASRSRCWSAS